MLRCNNKVQHLNHHQVVEEGQDQIILTHRLVRLLVRLPVGGVHYSVAEVVAAAVEEVVEAEEAAGEATEVAESTRMVGQQRKEDHLVVSRLATKEVDRQISHLNKVV